MFHLSTWFVYLAFLAVGFVCLCIVYGIHRSGVPTVEVVTKVARPAVNLVTNTLNTYIMGSTPRPLHEISELKYRKALELAAARQQTQFRATRQSSFLLAAGPNPKEDGGEDEEVKCEHVTRNEDVCAFVTDTPNCNEAANVFDYLKFRYCTMYYSGAVFPAFVMITVTIIWLFILISLMGTTADSFFVPALTLVSKELNLSPTVAGITFLALGNGAPDIFTALAGVAGDDFPLVLGALFGAGVCIMCFVIGNVICTGVTIPATNFWRDLGAYTACMAIIIGVCLDGKIYLSEGIIFISLYVAYVTVVVTYLQCKRCQRRRMVLEAKAEGDRAITQSMENGVALVDSAPNNAPIPPPNNEASVDASSSSSSSSSSDANVTSPNEDVDVIGAGGAEGDDDDDDDVDQAVWLDGLSYPHPDWVKKQGCMACLLRLQFLVEWPFSVLRHLTVPSPHVRPDRWGPAKRFFGLATPLFIPFLVLLNARGPDGFSETEVGDIPAPALCALLGVIVTLLFNLWFHKCVKYADANVVHANKAEYAGAPDHVFDASAKASLLEDDGEATEHGIATSTGIRDIGIESVNGSPALSLMADPTVSKSKSTKKKSKQIEDEDAIEIDDEYVPKCVTAFQLVVALIAFVAAVNWLYLIASEIVAILQSLGIMFDVSTAILGLTVLAIGNSVPDWIANTAVARAGRPQVAIASCFGAPLLTTLVGLGLALTITCLRQYPEPFVFDLSGQVILTWGTLGFALVLHMIMFPLFHYSPHKYYGIFLIIIYPIFLLISVLREIKAF